MNRFFALAVFCLFSIAGFAFADVTMVEELDSQNSGVTFVYKMSVTPAAEPSPAFKYRLSVPLQETVPGNAAMHYTRSYAERNFDSPLENVRKKFGDDFYDWIGSEIAIKDLPLEKMREASKLFDSYVEQFIVRATKCRTCDWGLGEEDLFGFDVFGFYLSEVQQNRSIARVLVLRTRLAIAEGRYDDAIEHLRMNYQLGQNAAKVKFLVADLVGIAIVGMSHQATIDLIGAEDSPNMYWALAELPRPMVDMRDSVRLELGWGARLTPELLDVETAKFSDEEWKRVFKKSLSTLFRLEQSIPNSRMETNTVDHDLIAFGMALRGYPSAKERLLAQGMSAVSLDAMCVSQVLLLDMMRENRRVADEFEKIMYVPFSEAQALSNRAEQMLGNGSSTIWDNNLGLVMTRTMLPALIQVYKAQVRIEWQRSALMVIEAIRMHLAKTGKLPAKLSDITIVPVPQNPITQRPYQYRVEGQTAILELPFSDGLPSFAQRFEITVAK